MMAMGDDGRILNVLYLTHQGLLDLPILYLSAYIIKTKDRYYTLLAQVSQSGDFKEWVAYILEGIAKSAEATIHRVQKIKKAMEVCQNILQKQAIHHEGFMDQLFYHPYTKIKSVAEGLGITRQTASKYLKICENLGILRCVSLGRNKYFVNVRLFELFRRELIC
ncbi:Fic family protein [Helicobacter ailurogastricus]